VSLGQTFQYQFLQRNTDVDLIPNSILTREFTAKTQTDGTSGATIISTYSLFDKYFNSWFSAEMVVSNFGPTFFSEAGRLLGGAEMRGWFWDISNSKFHQWFRNTFTRPDQWFGKQRLNQFNNRLSKYHLYDVYEPLIESTDGWTGGYKFTAGSGWRKFKNNMMDPEEGIVGKITDPVRRRELAKSVAEIRGYQKTNQAMMDKAKSEFDNLIALLRKQGIEDPFNHPAGQAARVNYGSKVSGLYESMDATISLDFPEYFSRESFSGMYDMAVKDATTGEFYELSGDSTHIGKIMREFGKQPDFKSIATPEVGSNTAYVTKNGGEALSYYRIGAGNEIASVPADNIEQALSKYKDKFVQLDNGKRMQLAEHNMNFIKSNISGDVKILDGGWEHAGDWTPLDFSDLLVRDRSLSKYSAVTKNIDDFYKTLRESNYIERRFFSALDKAFAQQDELLKDYFILKGGVKWTLYPFIFWEVKRGGAEIVGEDAASGLSAYMLPESWEEISSVLGNNPIYQDAYIDYFANAGSDQGDIFSQVLNKLPWKMILDTVSEKYNPLKKTFQQLTGTGVRNKVENIALYMTTSQRCYGCTSVINSQTGKDFSPAFDVTGNLDAYMVEDAGKEAREIGTTLISFSHHTNMVGEEGGEPIDLVKAEREGNTCREAVKEALLGWDLGSRAGGVMAAGESLSYFLFGWAGGGFSTVVQQIMVAPKIAGCIDTEEGYYTHMFAASDKEAEGTEQASKLSAENISEMVSDGTNTVMDSLSGGEGGALAEQAQKVKEQVEKFTKSQTKPDVVESVVSMRGESSGKISSPALFYHWFKGETNASKYREDGKKVISDKENGIDVDIDFEDGKIKVNGEGVIDDEDAVRLTSTNTNIPAEEIPQNLTKVKLSGTGPLFRLDVDGRFTVLDKQVLDCIKAGVLEQTAVPLYSSNLTDAFGQVKSIVTDSHPAILVKPSEKIIIAEGVPREVVEGTGAHAMVYGSREVKLSNSRDVNVGLFDSIQFENGVIVYKPETNELIVWLKHHKNAVLNQTDVAGLKADLTQVTNPVTNCPEPAVDLSAIATEGSEMISTRVENFNDSMKHLGPFQVFDTPTKRFIIYSKYVEEGGCNGLDCCKNFFKVIDKQTGEVYESEIVDGGVEQTADGIKITTEDGKTHDLEFSADGGIPMLKYNDSPEEVLTSAQGKNGSFYYDPDKGLWYPENAQLLPLLEAFKQVGVGTSVGPDGAVTSNATGNSMNVNIGSGSGSLLDLPSLPTDLLWIAVFISSLAVCFVWVRKTILIKGQS